MIVFQNKGLLPVIAITTMGVNAKADDSAIGYFGTGLKYAIAVILRLGGQVAIRSGNDTYNFGTVSTIHRDKTFEVVTMNGEPLGFTTELGKNWELWMAYRELYCNALDEGGCVSTAENGSVLSGHTDDMTSVLADCPGILPIHEDRGSIVLQGTPFETHALVNVHRGHNELVYFKGVRIYKLQSTALFTYNITQGLDISEDRSAKYFFQVSNRIAMAILQSENREFIREALTALKGYLEHSLDYSDLVAEPSDAFLEVAQDLRWDRALNLTALRVLSRHGRLELPKSTELDGLQQKQLERAISFCQRLGYDVTKYPITITKDFDTTLLGLAKDKCIYLSTEIFNHGTKYVAHGLIEEFFHLETGFGDETRDLQSYLFKQLITMGERVLMDPL